MSRRVSWRARVGRALAVVAVIVAVAAVSLFAWVKQAQAEVERTLWALGAQMSEIGSGGVGPLGARTLVVNGTVVELRSGTVDDALDDVLDEAIAACNRHEDAMFDTALSDRDERHGFAACFPALGGLGPVEIYELGTAMTDDGDLRGVGAFHYTYAKATPRGTHVIHAVMPELDLGAMFPASGDAPGSDVPGIPRPPGSQRIVSAAQVDSPHQLVAYRGGDGNAAAVIAGYLTTLREAGWDVHQRDAGASTLVAFRGGVLAVITVHDDPGGVSVTVGAGL